MGGRGGGIDDGVEFSLLLFLLVVLSVASPVPVLLDVFPGGERRAE